MLYVNKYTCKTANRKPVNEQANMSKGEQVYRQTGSQLRRKIVKQANEQQAWKKKRKKGVPKLLYPYLLPLS